MAWVWFDLMGVVFSQHHLVKRVLAPLLEEKGVSRQQVKERYLLVTLGQLSVQQFWEDMVGEEEAIDLNEKFLSQHSLESGFWELIEYLKPDYQLALCSNQAQGWVDQLIGRFDLSVFDCMFISSQMGVRKPDPRYFELILAELSVSGSECYFIDDRLSNLASAAEFGVHTIHFDRGVGDGFMGYPPEQVITGLSQLEDIL